MLYKIMSLLFISEIGMNYNGKFENCEEMIKQSQLAGADIAKFQLGWKEEVNFFDYSRIKQLYDWGDKYGIEIMFSILKPESLELLKQFKIKRIKIASRSLVENFKLCEDIVSLGYETIISLGMWKNKSVLPFDGGNIRYLWCNSKYPTNDQDLIHLPKDFKKEKKIVGYSDHCVGVDAALLAISRGAQIVEKHFTLDKTSDFIRDHALSAEPDELKNLITLGRQIHNKLSLGV